MKIICPKDQYHTTFVVKAVVHELWKVDDEGEYQKTLETIETLQGNPDEANVYACLVCGKRAKIEDGP